MRRNKEIGYSDTPSAAMSGKALLTVKMTFFPDAENPNFVRISGKCPRCEHDLKPYDRWLVVGAGAAPADEPREKESLWAEHGLIPNEIEFGRQCNCGIKHPDTPKGKTGCGAPFMLRVKRPS